MKRVTKETIIDVHMPPLKTAPKSGLPYHEHMEHGWFLYAIIALVGILLVSLVAFFSTIVNRDSVSNGPKFRARQRTDADNARMLKSLGEVRARSRTATTQMLKSLGPTVAVSDESRAAMLESLNR